MSADRFRSARALRLLFVAPFAPRLDATHGGGRAMAELIAQLAERHQLALLYLRGPGEPAVDERLRAACDVVWESERPARTGPAGWARLATGLLADEPMWVGGWRVPALAVALRTVAADWRPDLVQFEYHIMGQYLPVLRSCQVPQVLRQMEPGAAAAGDRAGARRGLGRWVSGLDRRAWARYEGAVMDAADAVVTLTERDTAALRPLAPAARFECIPLATSMPDSPLDPAGSGTPTLLFIGNFLHPPNLDAATRLARNIFPCIRSSCPAAVLCIVGPDPMGRVASLAGEGITVTGAVPDVRPYLDRAAVVIAPLRLGGGMRVKVMEALGAGKALLASPLAVEGLAVTDGEQAAIAETDEEFVTRSVALLSDVERRVALARAGRAWAVANLGWERRLAEYEALYASLIAP